ncbi:type II toxin-antitoxin system death-on-curing family toxin [Mucilaginibacter mali]|uniref:Type II toxin-antitoxin system death-on-curing family toxin n=1 Tax=Mucilaginibacter mali TaxID=2740462 RepID=A0A7D4PUA3_9SPHI|nr:type II toxin-antitoxin system death-on-curing family toxin [Mucilaginibacter mali]QKJ30548.1 type II toxin-antitoxin system death-on-curing family toxin [Mucilaginibacter mali]
MIILEEVIQLHNEIINLSGGGNGLRDEGSLMAALARPFATFDQIDLYPTAIEKATAIFESIVINHPFIDGNKRTSYVLMRLMLREGGWDINVTEDEKYEFVIAASTGEIRFDEIKAWLEAKATKL